MHLIYFTIGHTPFYVELLEFCLLTIHAKTDMTQFQIMVMCDESYMHLIEPLKSAKLIHHIMKTAPNQSPPQVSMRKVEIFDFELIDSFEKILYLDSDLICINDISQALTHVTKEDKLYVCNESTNIIEHTLPFFGFCDYSQEELKLFQENNVYVFNCGQFAFCNSPHMREHFANVRENIRTNTKTFFYEQSFMNEYFNRKLATDNSLGKFFSIVTRKQPITTNTCAIHFANVGMPARMKLDIMRETWCETNAPTSRKTA